MLAAARRLGARLEQISEDDAFHPSCVAAHFIQLLMSDSSEFDKTGSPFFNVVLLCRISASPEIQNTTIYTGFYLILSSRTWLIVTRRMKTHFTKAYNPELRCGSDRGPRLLKWSKTFL